MSNQCSNLFEYRSFSLFTPFYTPLKPYPTILRPIFPFHNSLILNSRRSRSRTSYVPLAAQSSSDIVLIATTERQDGSFVFRFGDACEVVEEIESQAEPESNAVTILDGDQERQVLTETIEGGYGNDGGTLTEVDDGIRNADIDSDFAETDTKVISDFRDYHAELSETLSDISEEEVLSLQSDAQMNNSLEGVESTLNNKTECAAQLDGGESLNPTISLLDNSPNRDKSADPEGFILKDSDDEIEDPSVSVKLESMQVSHIEVMDVKKSHAKDELHKVKREDTSESDTKDVTPPATMRISDVELTDAAKEDAEEGLQDMKINEGTLIDEMPPSNLGGEPTLDEVSQLQFGHVEVEAIMKVSSTKAMDVEDDQAMEDKLQQMSTNKRDEIDVAYEMPISYIEEAEPLLEEEVSQLQSAPVKLEATMEVSSTKGIEVEDRSVEDEFQQGSTNSNDENDVAFAMPAEPVLEEEVSQLQSAPVKLEATMEVSSTKGIEVEDRSVEDEFQQGSTNNNDENDVAFAMPAEPILEEEVSQLQYAPVKPEATMEVSTTKGMDIEDHAVEGELQQASTSNNDENDVAYVSPVEPILVEEVSQLQSAPVMLEATMEVSTTKGMDIEDQAVEDELQQASTSNNDENDVAYGSPVEPILVEEATMEVSATKGMDVEDQAVEDELQQASTNNNDENDVAYVSQAEPILEEEVSQLQYAPVKLEVTMEVSTTKGLDVEDQAVKDDLQQGSTNNNDENDVGYVMPAEQILEEKVSQIQSTPLEIKPTTQVSDIEVQDTIGQNLDDGIVQVIDEDASKSCIKNVERSSYQLETQPVQDEGVNHNMLEQCAETDPLGSSILLKQGTCSSLLEAERIEDMVSSSELVEASEDSATVLATEAKVIREEIYLTGYFLSSGAALLEHPSKALTGGDDAYFVAGSKWLGMANGVSQWSFEGTDPGIYAQELMRTCEEIVLDTSRAPISNPAELLCRGVKETNMSGSSSVLIANFDDQALHVANIGDTGFLIIRHGAIYKKSSPLLHEFHFSLQVDECDDPLQLVEEHTIELDEGDIIVSATDGLFDNLYEREIAMIVSKSLQAGMKPEEIANALATRAQEVGRSAFVRSPFSDAAQAAGYTGCAGGKPDNVAVIISLVEKRSNLLAPSDSLISTSRGAYDHTHGNSQVQYLLLFFIHYHFWWGRFHAKNLNTHDE
ncbi:Protein phosphatase 2C (PP2C)-like protein, partial [Cynara cardunculus var. scolymus]